MYRKIILLLASVVLFFYATAQLPKYNRLAFFDDFNDSSIINWSVKNDVDNLYMMENSNYELFRKNPGIADIVFCRWENPYNNFELRMNFRFERNKKNKAQYTGFIFKAGKSDALLAEVNGKSQVRIRKIDDGKSSYLSGTKEKEGWVKGNGLKSDYNNFMVHCQNDTYSVFINNILILSIPVSGYVAGRMGLVMGGNTNISINNLGVYLEDKKTPPRKNDDSVSEDGDDASSSSDTGSAGSTYTRSSVSVNNSNAELQVLQKKIYDLQQQLNTYRNKMYQEQDRADSLQAIFDVDGKRDYRDENRRLLRENVVLNKLNDSLYVLLQTYNEVSNALYKGDGNAIGAKLAEKLREEKALNYELEKRNKELEVQNKKLTLQQKSQEAEIEKLKSHKAGKKE